ncbi:MAG: DUF3857 domain-containing protein [Planctomycetota bacterium]|jgi:predicted Zn-dependent protease
MKKIYNYTCLLLLALTLHINAGEVSFPFNAEEKKYISTETKEGWQKYFNGKLSDAEKLFNKALKKNPRSHFAYFGLESVYNSLGKYREAGLEINKALKYAENSPWLELYLEDGLSLLEFSKNPAGFTSILERLLKDKRISDSRKNLIRYTLAKAYLRSGNQKKGLQNLDSLDFVRDWQLLGPFSNREKAGFMKELAPEKRVTEIDLKKSYDGRTGQISWFKVKNLSEAGYLDIASLLYPEDENVAFAKTDITAEKDGPYDLTFGTAGAAAVWLNGKKLWQWNEYHNYYPFQRSFTVNLTKGSHSIIIKIAGERNSRCGLSLLFSPAEKAAPVSQTPDLSKDAGLNWGLVGQLKNDPENPFSLCSLGYMYLRRKLDDKLNLRTRPLFEKSAAMADNSPLFLEFAAMIQKDDNKAKELLAKAIKINPGEIAARELLAARTLDGGFRSSAEKFCREILKAENSAEAHELLGDIYQEKRWRPEAFLSYTRAYGSAPLRIRLYIKASKNAVSHKIRKDILDEGIKKTGSADLKRRLAELLLKENNAEKTRLENFALQNIALNPFSLTDRLLLADCYLKFNEKEKACKVLAEAVSCLPFNPALLEKAGRTELLCGRKDNCIKYWKRSLAVSPENPLLRKNLEEIEPAGKNFYDDYAVDIKEIIEIKAEPDDYPKYNTAVLLDQGISRVNQNGTRDMYIHFARKALRSRGAQELNSYTIGYNPKRERIKVLAAKVYQPDGSVISAKGIRDISSKGGGGQGTIYDKHHGMKISFPQVKAGSIVEVKYTNESTGKNVYGDQFEEVFFFGGNNPTARFEYIVLSPKELAVKLATFGKEKAGVTQNTQEKGGTVIHRFTAENIPGFEIEPQMPPYEEVAPAVRVSTFKSWNDVGAWYWDLSKDSFELPKDIIEDTLELVKGINDRDKKIAAVYYKVIDKVRYVGIELGRNGYVPHQAERTYRTNYGDCKDTAVLMAAMLKTAGVDAKVALVRTWERGKEPTGLPGARRFNHAICYIPPKGGKEYWLDGTTDYNHVTELPTMDQGGAALITGPDGGKFVTIAEEPAEENSDAIFCTMNISKDGSAEVTAKMSYKGAYAASYRRIFESPDRFKVMLENFIKRRFPGAKFISFKTSSPDLKVKETYFEFKMQVPDMAVKVNGEYKVKPVVLPQGLSRMAMQSKRKHDLMLNLKRSHIVKTIIKLPEGSAVKSVPQNKNSAHTFASHTRDVKSENGTVSYKAETKLKVRRIKLADYNSFKEFCNKTDSSEEEWVIFEMKP